MGVYSKYNAEAVLENVEARIAENRRLRTRDVCDELSIFDWWKDNLTVTQLKQMQLFLNEAIKLGYTGYVCFKVGAKGCANGMWAFTKETLSGYSPDDCPALYRSFTPDYTYWDVSNLEGEWWWDAKFGPDSNRDVDYRNIKTIKQLEEFIEQNKDKVYRA